MAEIAQSRPHRVGKLLGGLYFELLILIFCAAMLSNMGKSTGPVFDVVGPDFLPSVVAGLVAALTVLQVGLHVLRWHRSVGDAKVAAPADILRGRILAALFSFLTIVYVAVLSRELTPFYLATAVYLTLTTVLLARRLDWRDLILGAVLGLVMGIGLQLIFTRVLIIDLPV